MGLVAGYPAKYQKGRISGKTLVVVHAFLNKEKVRQYYSFFKGYKTSQICQYSVTKVVQIGLLSFVSEGFQNSNITRYKPSYSWVIVTLTTSV